LSNIEIDSWCKWNKIEILIYNN